MNTICLASNSFQDGRATRPRRAQDDKHLALTHQAIELMHNLDALTRPTAGPTSHAGKRKPNIRNGFLIISASPEAVDTEALEANASRAKRGSILGKQGNNALCPFRGAEPR